MNTRLFYLNTICVRGGRAANRRSQTSDTPQRYIKAIPREGEFAFDREPSPAGNAAAEFQ